MGSDAEHKNELDPAIIAHGRPLCRRQRSARRAGSANCIMPSRPASSPPTRDFPELGQIVAGLSAGPRSTQPSITIADLTGTGVQDTAIATLARDRARAASAGTPFES